MSMQRNNIKARLAKMGVTQTQVAEELGISRSFLSRWIAGRQTSRRVYRHFVEVLGMPKSYFKKYSEMDEAA
jgi:transcriptional regulator with XRE-family HTH domain